MDDLHRPSWGRAVSAAVTALVAVLALEAFAAMAWIQGAGEAGLDRPIDSTLTLFPGSVVRYQTGQGAAWIGWTPGWLCLVAALLAFLVVAGTSTRVSRGADRAPGPAR